jgi:hypothetical protein
MGLASVYGGTGADAINLSAVGASRGLYVVPGGGDDSVLLGLGNDVYVPGAGADSVHSGAGVDTLLIAQGVAGSTFSAVASYNPFGVSGTAAQLLAIDLGNTSAAQSLASGSTLQLLDAGFDVVDASAQLNASIDLALIGTSSANTLLGGAGDDYVRSMGTAGNSDASGNVLAGGRGSDYIRSGDGADTMYGGSATGLLESADTIGLGDNDFFSHLFSGSIADSVRSGTTFDFANIYEGRGGDDVMVASQDKDIFLYQTKNVQGSDTIYNFTVGEDFLFGVSQRQNGSGTDYVWFGDTVGAARDVGSAQIALLASDSVPSGAVLGVQGTDVTLSAGTTVWSLAPVAGVAGSYLVKFDADGNGSADFTVTLVGVLDQAGVVVTALTDINKLFPPGGG